jgi:hypothetical protein
MSRLIRTLIRELPLLYILAMNSFNLNSFLRGSICEHKYLEVRAATYELGMGGEGAHSVHNTF